MIARLLALIVWLGMAGSVGAQQACGSHDQSCSVPLGQYYAAVPRSDGPHPLLIFFHGAGGDGRMVHDPQGYLTPFVDAGFVVITPQGLSREGGFGAGWSFRPEGPQQRDELQFVRQVIADSARFGIDPARILLSGFSIGGSLTWYLACKEPGLARAYAPLAGGFWRPHPQTCAGPVEMLHTHGWADRVVPLEGRLLRSGTLQQGDIFEGLQLWRSVNGCTLQRPDEMAVEGQYWLRRWTTCEGKRALTLALHPGGHDDVPADWAQNVIRWFGKLD